MSRAQLTSTVEQNTGGAVAPFVAGKNKIINGDFYVNQRGFTSTTSGGYSFDRWTSYQSSGTVTWSSQTFTAGAAPVAGYEGKNYSRVVTTGQTGTSAAAIFVQNIEDVRTLAGQTATISFWAKAASGTPKIGIEIKQGFGTGGSPSADVFTPTGSVTLSTSWVRYTSTIAIPSISGKTIGTNNDSILALDLWVSAGTDFNTRASSIGIQSNTFDIWGVQLEAGSVATPFTTATGTVQGELAACQRYFYTPLNTTTDGIGGSPFLGMGWASSTTTAYILCSFPVTMRAIPSYTYSYASSSLSITTASYGVTTVTSLGADQIMQRNAILSFSASGGGLVAGNAAGVRHDGAGTYIAQFSAEL